MSHPKRVRFYLNDGTRRRVKNGEHNFIAKAAHVLERTGYEVSYHPNTLAERLKAGTRRGYALCEMTPPPNQRAMTFRRVYHYPFWQIQASDKRWKWDVAQACFDPMTCPRNEAQRFFSYWQARIFRPLLDHIGDDDFIYIPLQGRLTDHRSFQSCSPIDMLSRTRAACPGKRIIATLHPKETYSPDEMTVLDKMQRRDPDLSIQTGGRDTLLPRCSYIVTMTSSVAFDGMFFGKPAIVFGQTDFHHVTLKGQDPNAFDRIQSHRPDYSAYLWWAWQHMAINGGHESAEAKIAAKLSAAGWPMG
ncbi:hypothetical protein [uncultured Tateyamaria sp.]|uniref:capsular polysaccharide export protein, LipB/KpsS family n=1 Tax=uncultured Tateyamaria sp. TaxID=455651 RepID=UPI002630D010|nr:hypothetical protein [uncultured Tateyamaria sp.]